jgi:hypothetical protein
MQAREKHVVTCNAHRETNFRNRRNSCNARNDQWARGKSKAKVESDLHLCRDFRIFVVKARFDKPAPRAQLPKDSSKPTQHFDEVRHAFARDGATDRAVETLPAHSLPQESQAAFGVADRPDSGQHPRLRLQTRRCAQTGSGMAPWLSSITSAKSRSVPISWKH